jgi:type I restriction enzyme S subunit
MSWHTTRLGDVLTLKRGHDLPDSERKDGDIPIVSSSGITGYHNEPRAKAPGVVTGRYGTLGEVFYVEKDYWPLNTALYVTDFKGNHPRFVAYFLQNVLKSYQSDKAAVPGVNRNVIHKLKVQYPDIKSQEHIVKILSSYDDFIDTNRRRIQLLEELARLLFREWFVYFRFPLRLRSGQAGHRKVKIVDGVPEGWERGTVGHLAKVRSGYAYNSKNWEEEGNPVVKIGNIVGDGTVNLDCCSYIDEDIATKTKDFALIDGDLLIAMTGATIGKVGLLLGNVKTAYLNQRVGKFYPKFDGAELLMYCFFMSDMAQTHITNYAGGAAQPNISASQIESIKIIVATRNIYTQFISSVKPMFEEILILRSQNQKFAQARDLLLPRLMSGVIDPIRYDKLSNGVEV